MVQNSYRALKPSSAGSNFHLLIPATSSNKGLCQLLLSGVVLNYPPPVLINWDAVEDENPYKQHLAKIDTILHYLKEFPPEKDNDLVLIVDGFDVWFQLPPDVVIRRYFETMRIQNERLVSTYGAEVVKKHDMRQTVLFGPDKLCWPSQKGRRPACWAVPPSTVPDHAFGPNVDVALKDASKDPYHARARWLNSGTILGPAADVRALFEETSNSVRTLNEGDSDQWYFAKIWGIQEYSRLLLQPNVTLPSKESVDIPEVSKGTKTDYHIGIDYESSIFLNVGYYDPYISWVRYDGSLDIGRPQSSQISNYDRFELADDIGLSPAPLSAMNAPNSGEQNELDKALYNYASTIRIKEWRDLPLATNVITKQVCAMVHFTFEKDYRDAWWNNMWYVPFGKDLLRASGKARDLQLIKKRVNGTTWYNSPGPVVAHSLESTHGRRDGAWSDKGKWIPWSVLCEVHQDGLFGKGKEHVVNDG